MLQTLHCCHCRCRRCHWCCTHCRCCRWLCWRPKHHFCPRSCCLKFLSEAIFWLNSIGLIESNGRRGEVEKIMNVYQSSTTRMSEIEMFTLGFGFSPTWRDPFWKKLSPRLRFQNFCRCRGCSVGRASFERSFKVVQLSDWRGFESRSRHEVVGKKFYLRHLWANMDISTQFRE